jgi:hypothetical protein
VHESVLESVIDEHDNAPHVIAFVPQLIVPVDVNDEHDRAPVVIEFVPFEKLPEEVIAPADIVPPCVLIGPDVIGPVVIDEHETEPPKLAELDVFIPPKTVIGPELKAFGEHDIVPEQIKGTKLRFSVLLNLITSVPAHAALNVSVPCLYKPRSYAEKNAYAGAAAVPSTP